MKTYTVEHPVFPAEVSRDEVVSLEAQAEPVMAFGRE